MIQKLRWKFIGIIMTFVTLFLVAIFVTLYVSTKMGYAQRSMDALRSAALSDGPNGPSGGNRFPLSHREDPVPPARTEIPLMVVDVSKDGNIQVVKNNIPGIEDKEAETLVNSEALTESSSGTIPDRHLRYLWEKKGPSGTRRYVFADIYSEVNSLHEQIIHSTVIGICAFVGFFLFSIFLSNWAVKPMAEAWEQQRRFVADASHELKTPLTVILSNVSLISQSASELPPKSQQRLEYIHAEAKRMRRLVESLLILARIDSKSHVSPHTPLDLSYVVNSRVMVFEPLFFDVGKDLLSNIEEHIWVMGDEKKLAQLVDILLDNACKYGKEDGRIDVRLFCRNKKEALLIVENEGTPLNQNEIRQIFDRFYRANSTKNDVSGCGLGLSIAKKILEEHSGVIEAGTDGVGRNCFSVRLPLYAGLPYATNGSPAQTLRDIV